MNDIVKHLFDHASSVRPLLPQNAKKAADTIERLRAELAAKIPEGYALVPKVPTLAMTVAGAEAITKDHMKALANYDAACDAWPAMIAAAEGD